MSSPTDLYIITQVEETEATTAPFDGQRDGRTDTGGGWDEPKRSATEELIQTLRRKRVPLDAHALKSQMQGMIAIINDLFEQAEPSGGLQLNEVELSVEINAEGQVSLVGNGGKLGNTGGITLKFTRPEK